MTASAGVKRTRAYLEFITAVLYFFLARAFARRLAVGIQSDAWAPLLEQFLLAVLLVLGYAAFGSLFDRQSRSIAAQGLPLRSGWPREIGLGLAIGWGAVAVCALFMVLVGGIAIVLSTQRSSFAWLLADAAYFSFFALA